MPEGDTILRAARTLDRWLAGKVVQAFRSPLPALRDASLAGTTIQGVESRGKYLIVRFSDGRRLLTHMQMSGSWHLYRPGEAWKRPARLAGAVIETEDAVAVCFSAPLVELLTQRGLERHPRVRGLGPDVLAGGFSVSDAASRLRARGASEIGEALLAQRALAGIGNVYKSEALFLCRLSPFTRVSDLTDAQLHAVVERARKVMADNVEPGRPRATRRAFSGSRLWVYRRSGQPCLRCGTRIERALQGATARSTYWCPACQPAPAGITPSARTTPSRGGSSSTGTTPATGGRAARPGRRSS